MKANRTFNVRSRPTDLVLDKPELYLDPVERGNAQWVLFLSAAFRDGKDRHLRISMSNAERRQLAIMLMRGGR